MDELLQKMMAGDGIKVTSPLLPPLDEFTAMLEDIWSRRWITNNGTYHQQLEAALQTEGGEAQ